MQCCPLCGPTANSPKTKYLEEFRTGAIISKEFFLFQKCFIRDLFYCCNCFFVVDFFIDKMGNGQEPKCARELKVSIPREGCWDWGCPASRALIYLCV